MISYLPATIWIIGAVICYYIAKYRNVPLNIFWSLVVVVLGPFAIPFMFFAKPQPKVTSD